MLSSVPWYGYTKVCSTIHWKTPGLFPLLTIIHKAVINIHVQGFIQFHLFVNINFHFFRINTQRMQLLGLMVIAYLVFTTNCQTVSQGGCSILHIHQQYMSYPSCLHLVVSLFFISVSQLVYLFELVFFYKKSLFPFLIILTKSLRKWHKRVCMQVRPKSTKTILYLTCV